MAFQPLARKRLSTEIAAQIRSAIIDGTIPTGDRLPAERELAERFQVNRSTVREALRLLEDEGVVSTRHGDGTRALDVLKSAGLAMLPYLLAPAGKALDAHVTRDLLELRVELIAFAARLAAQEGPSGRELEALRGALLDLEAADDADEVQLLDFEFMSELARLGKNRVLVLLLNACRPAYLAIKQKFRGLYADFDPAAHRRLVDAIARGDAKAADRVAREITEGPLRGQEKKGR